MMKHILLLEIVPPSLYVFVSRYNTETIFKNIRWYSRNPFIFNFSVMGTITFKHVTFLRIEFALLLFLNINVLYGISSV